MGKMEEEIDKNGFCMLMTHGDSMFPMIKEKNSRVIVVKPQFPLKKYDVPVYRKGQRYVLHRIVKVKNGRYFICGDNRVRIEKDIPDDDIVGVLQGVCTDGKYTWCDDEEYLKYAKKVCRQYPIRWIKYKIENLKEKMKKIDFFEKSC